MSKEKPPLTLEITRRRIRSFVRREGRMTSAQKQALEMCWPTYGIEMQAEPIDLDAIFERSAPRVLDIGFGMGESLIAQARAHPEIDFVGVEVYRTGVGCLLHQCQQQGIHNIRVICHDVVDVLQQMIPENSFAGIMVFFPDPWPKKRHHKRRLLQASNLHLFASKVQPQGYLHIATDWQPYADAIVETMVDVAVWQPMEKERAQTLIEQRANTKYERRGERLGHDVADLVYVKAI